MMGHIRYNNELLGDGEVAGRARHDSRLVGEKEIPARRPESDYPT